MMINCKMNVKRFIVALFFLGSNTLYASDQPKKDDDNFLFQRRMFSLEPEYRSAHQLLVVKDLSSVLQYAERSILVVRLIDDSEVPFYRSTGKNSGLPETWLPFFGLRNDGWFHKNYTFDVDHNTHIPLNPLYHSGDYALAQVGSELDRLPIGEGNEIPDGVAGVATINYWIGGQM